MKRRVVLDLASLPMQAPSGGSLSWWGTLAYMLIEGTGFALVIGVYLYLESLAPAWPPDSPPPDLGPGTFLTLILLASLVPNILLSRWAGQMDLHKVRIGLVVTAIFEMAVLVPRAFEFGALHVSWDSNAYGSVLWLMLGLHTAHVLTDLVETLVLAVLMFTRHGDNARRYGDVMDGCLYWNFVVATWLPLYACIYWISRL